MDKFQSVELPDFSFKNREAVKDSLRKFILDNNRSISVISGASLLGKSELIKAVERDLFESSLFVYLSREALENSALLDLLLIELSSLNKDKKSKISISSINNLPTLYTPLLLFFLKKAGENVAKSFESGLTELKRTVIIKLLIKELAHKHIIINVDLDNVLSDKDWHLINGVLENNKKTTHKAKFVFHVRGDNKDVIENLESKLTQYTNKGMVSGFKLTPLKENYMRQILSEVMSHPSELNELLDIVEGSPGKLRKYIDKLNYEGAFTLKNGLLKLHDVSALSKVKLNSGLDSPSEELKYITSLLSLSKVGLTIEELTHLCNHIVVEKVQISGYVSQMSHSNMITYDYSTGKTRIKLSQSYYESLSYKSLGDEERNQLTWQSKMLVEALNDTLFLDSINKLNNNDFKSELNSLLDNIVAYAELAIYSRIDKLVDILFLVFPLLDTFEQSKAIISLYEKVEELKLFEGNVDPRIESLYFITCKFYYDEARYTECIKLTSRIEKSTIRVLLWKYHSSLQVKNIEFLDEAKARLDDIPKLEDYDTCKYQYYGLLCISLQEAGFFLEANKLYLTAMKMAENELCSEPDLFYFKTISPLFTPTESAQLICSQAVEFYRSKDNHLKLGLSLNNLAYCNILNGDYQNAEENLHASLTSLQQTYPVEIIFAKNNLAALYLYKGEFSKANELLQECLFYNLSPFWEACIRTNAALAEYHIGNHNYSRHFDLISKSEGILSDPWMEWLITYSEAYTKIINSNGDMAVVEECFQSISSLKEVNSAAYYWNHLLDFALEEKDNRKFKLNYDFSQKDYSDGIPFLVREYPIRPSLLCFCH